MLKGISPLLSPELLKILAEMGHGDEIVLGDSNYPGVTNSRRLLRADGLSITALLGAIAPLFPFETCFPPLVMMDAVKGDKLDPAVEADYLRVIHKSDAKVPAPVRIDKFSFYERSCNAHAVLMTGETRPYGNLILKKGVIA
jgi:L-fucose mutarotase